MPHMRDLRTIASLAVACPGQGIVTRGCLAGIHQKAQIHGAFPRQTPSRRLSHQRHSLGEYTALLLSGVLSLPQAIGVVRKRGLLMEALVKEKQYEMRVLVFKPRHYNYIFDIATKHGVLACVNNATQLLISGSPKKLDLVIQELNSSQKTVLQQVKLPVIIPFHSLILREIEPDLKALVSGSKPAFRPIISNHTGEISEGDLFGNSVKCNSAPVQWKKSMELLQKSGVDGVANLGPGSVVDAINAKFNLHNFRVKNVEDMHKLADLLNLE